MYTYTYTSRRACERRGARPCRVAVDDAPRVSVSARVVATARRQRGLGCAPHADAVGSTYPWPAARPLPSRPRTAGEPTVLGRSDGEKADSAVRAGLRLLSGVLTRVGRSAVAARDIGRDGGGERFSKLSGTFFGLRSRGSSPAEADWRSWTVGRSPSRSVSTLSVGGVRGGVRRRRARAEAISQLSGDVAFGGGALHP